MNSTRKILLWIDVIRRLGFQNVAYVAWYRFCIKYGLRKRFFPQRCFAVGGDFFRPAAKRTDYHQVWENALVENADGIIRGRLKYYSHHWKVVGTPPDWFLNPFENTRYPDPLRHWTVLPDFHPVAGDIKNIWEASRFKWVATLARAYAVRADDIYLLTLNNWLRDWALRNPINTGPNWKCGQEAAIRVFSLMQAALILNQWEHPRPELQEFVYRHLERIHSNIRYALSQNNNHGTSEAAALFIGGQWLTRIGKSRVQPQAKLFARQGRKWLENRIEKLVEPDGSFSQHSVTYHRLLLDTLSFVEYWREKFETEPFSERFYDRSKAAIDWMAQFTDPVSGDAPNLGANDGAMLLNTHSCDYRDFRPSLQTAAVLFQGKSRFGPGSWNEPLYWFGMRNKDAVSTVFPKSSSVLPGGYAIMAGKRSWGMLRFPMYRFRPSHNDVFHFDLWCDGENICRDAGSYSYNPGLESDAAYFKSVRAHNTVSFDGCEQMPRLGRFLLAKWIRAEQIGAVEIANDGGRSWTGSYKDHRGNRHRRTVTWRDETWKIEDRLSGPFETAEIFYRLIPAEYKIEGNKVVAPWGTVTVEASDCRIRMEEGFESLYYWEKQPVNTLVLRIGKNSGKVVTVFSL